MVAVGVCSDRWLNGPRRDYAEGTPLTMPRQAHLQRSYTALGHTERATGAVDRAPDKRGAPGSGARVEARTNTAS